MTPLEARRRKILYVLLFTGVMLLAAFVYELGGRVRLVPESIPTDLLHLAGYALASYLRMLVAYLFSLLFAVIFGSLAATSTNRERLMIPDRKSTRLNSSHDQISYAVFCL